MTANIQKYARSFGYEVPFAGVIPRIREAVSDKQMEQMNIWYIACLHMPIKDADGDPHVLGAYRDDDGRWLYTDWDYPDHQWNGNGAIRVPCSRKLVLCPWVLSLALGHFALCPFFMKM